MEDTTTLLPEWREAVRQFLAQGFKEGDIVTHDWLAQHFGLDRADKDKPMTALDYQERQFKWLANIEAFKTELLESHQVFLSSVHGEGYRVVPPREQTDIAQQRFESEARKAFRKAATTMKHVRLAELTDAERKANSDAIGKLSMLRGMVRKSLK